ncbi:dynactin ro-3 [Pyricularia oryzae 70-15]|uniref:Dynactin ro-3 n=3 Tax=Pyricularia oryzae TaxID=318829 RepID=G4NH27_PYRO7|nr:dynactin ro-3 [Pyricularia oryzae 70-15]EHA47537.1 dynactin ro-3 [Pyricularia oryzae 70-15]ELQ39089.1 dynactin [Pyricularia oryzae Y34]KAI7932662.1 dynactin ro-3 [Pyricularia oryzae]
MTNVLALGQTVELSDGRIAIVRFIGRTGFAQGDWLGVELPDDSGKNDGSVQGERYFDCDSNHGMFVRPSTVCILDDAPEPPPPQPAKTAAPVAKKPAGGRPSMFNGGGGMAARGTGGDPNLARRMSLNAPSPSPVPKASRPSSIVRSPTKSPTKQLATAPTSGASTRTGTPSNVAGRAVSMGAKVTRPAAATGATRTSMGPPSLPASRTSRPSSTSSRVASGASGAPTRTLSGRSSMAGGARTLGTRPSVGTRGGAAAGQAAGKTAVNKRASEDSSSSKGELEILSPQPTSPVRSRAAALERLTASPAAAAAAKKRPAASTTATATVPASAPAANRQASTNATALIRENENLNSKLTILERKRAEDREKIKELDQVKEERDKYHTIIQKLQAKIQPQQAELAELRKQVKEAEARFESVENLQMEHDQVLELATLDREMAEETAEVLKQELSDVKMRLEELELEVEILREENEEFNKGISPEERSSAGWLQMERNNERMREALIRLRDMSQQQEKEMQEQIKSLELDLKEAGDVQAQLEAAKEKLSTAENMIEDLRSQLETALGAEEMIEDLTDRNMSQAEKIEELKAEVEDLESLKEIADELEANHVQHERELQEEIDFKNAVIAEQARRFTQQEESMEEMEYTLSRFRELVTSLQTDLEDMRASNAVNETESEQLNSKSRAMMDLNMKLQLSASKAQVKTIDLELRRMEAQEAAQHLEIVKMFLPETYDADKDSVMALLRFRRLAFKANLLNGFIRERVNREPHPGHEDDVFAGCDAVDKLTWVAAMCDRFVNAITHCSLERFARFEGALYELEPVERALNAWIDGLRRDELKESQCASELSRSLALMTHLGEVHIAPANEDLMAFADDVHMRTQLVQSHLESAASTVHAVRAMVQRVIPPVGEDDELAQHFARKAETLISQTRSTKVVAGKTLRALEDMRARSLALSPETSAEAFEQAETAARGLASLARQIGLDLHMLLSQEGREEPYTYIEVQSTVHRTVQAVMGTSESDLFSAYLAQLRVLTTQMNDLASQAMDLGQTQEFEKPQAPWIMRAQELKAQRTAPADAEEEMRHLREEYNEARRQVAMREEGLSTAQVKIETLEARMRDANTKSSRIAELEAHLEQLKQVVASREDDLVKQDREAKALEADRDKWKKAASDAARGGAVAGQRADTGAGVGHERAVATARQMDALKEEIEALQSAVRYLREDNRRARTTEQGMHDWLAEPLRREQPISERRKALVAAEGKDALAELLRMAGSATVFDLSSLRNDASVGKNIGSWRPIKSTPRYHAAKQAEDLAVWRSWQDSVKDKSQTLLVQELAASSAPYTAAAPKSSETARAARKAAARLQIRLPGADGKMMTGAGNVQIVGSREWDGLQGRLAAV